jgi:putative ABC transport system permease protein
VQVDKDVDPEAVCAAIQKRIPQVDAYTKTQYSAISVNYWMTRTGIGLSFGAATLLGVLVGLVMVAQALYAMVLDRLAEFGTLKAMGASEFQLLVVVLWQALVMGISGSLIGIAFVGMIQFYFDSPKAPILVPLWLSLGSCALVSVICLVSALIPYARIRKVDPLMVLQT